MYSIITGGSSGLGFEIAKALVLSEQNVMIIGRDSNKLNQAVRSLRALDMDADIQQYSADISSEEDVNALCLHLAELSIPVKNVFNVAGSAFFGRIEDINKTDIEQVFNTNLTGLILFSIKLSVFMKNNPLEKQRIISILSTAALKGKKNETIYNAAKWGARGFLESLRDELTETSIEVINVFPGGMKTPFWNNSESGYAIDTFMDPADVADHVVRVTLDENVLVTDITIGRPK